MDEVPSLGKKEKKILTRPVFGNTSLGEGRVAGTQKHHLPEYLLVWGIEKVSVSMGAVITCKREP